MAAIYAGDKKWQQLNSGIVRNIVSRKRDTSDCSKKKHPLYIFIFLHGMFHRILPIFSANNNNNNNNNNKVFI